MSEAELEWLAEQAATHYRIVEVGSFLGRSTRALAEHTPGVVYAFDDWQGPREAINQVLLTPDGAALEVKPFVLERTSLFSRFVANVSDLLTSGKVRVIRGDHANTSVLPVEWIRGSHQPEDRPDMVFIDGGHEYEEVKRDILIWRARLAPGGLLCGHDTPMEGVYQALLEAFSHIPCVPFTDLWSVHV